eukprot:TRINITY_DN598_c0_g1_i4.p1 TRINITY_DN598_c0_g1~~TRINITY_DN598_c0_g1_i4.p1  ORF type:complete len:354 (-),score=64.75 TRINITY_DN598_c0_g1_i4:627-1568(-)
MDIHTYYDTKSKKHRMRTDLQLFDLPKAKPKKKGKSGSVGSKKKSRTLSKVSREKRKRASVPVFQSATEELIYKKRKSSGKKRSSIGGKRSGGKKVEPYGEGVLYVQIVHASACFFSEKKLKVFCVLSTSFGRQVYKTKTMKQSSEVWHERYEFVAGTLEGCLNVDMFCQKKAGRVRVGKGSFDLLTLKENVEQTITVSVQSEVFTEDSCSLALLLFHRKVSNMTVVEEEEHFEEHYTLGKEIGRGGFGVVYRATHKRTEMEYAVKIIHQEKGEEEKKITNREMEILRKLRNDYIIQFQETFWSDSHIYLVME